MTSRAHYAAMADPARNPQFRRRWHDSVPLADKRLADPQEREAEVLRELWRLRSFRAGDGDAA